MCKKLCSSWCDALRSVMNGRKVLGLGRSATALYVTPYTLHSHCSKHTSSTYRLARKMCNPEVQKAQAQNGSQSGTDCLTAVSEADTSRQVTLPDSQAFKQKGNDLLKDNKPKSALQAYASALKAAADEHVDDEEKAVLLSNRSYAYLKCNLFVKARSSLLHIALYHDHFSFHSTNSHAIRMRSGRCPLNLFVFVQAEGDARLATKLAPTWPKPLHRLAQALQVLCLDLQHS